MEHDPNYPYYVPQFGIGEQPAPFPGTGFDAKGNPELVASGGASGTTNFNQLTNRPSYAGTTMTGTTNIPTVPTKLADLSDGGTVATIATNLATETDARQKADAEIQTAVSNNATDITNNTTLINKVSTDLETLEQTVASDKTEVTAALATESTARQNADAALTSSVEANATNISANTTGLAEVNTKLGKTIQLDTVVSSDASTVTLTKSTGSLGADGQTNTELPLPVASATQAGVMNPATYNAIQENSELISSILNGAVAVAGLPAVPTQEELTNAWKSATSETELINRASIFDSTNNKVWYYYSNVAAWQATSSDGSQVTVNQATNTSLGIVKGSTTDGQVAIEADGSMSLNGYDDLKTKVDNSETRTTNLPTQVVYNTSVPEYKESEVDLTLIVKDLHTGGDASLPLNIMGASATQAGVMTTAQVSQLTTNTANIASLTTQLTSAQEMIEEVQKDANDALADISALEADQANYYTKTEIDAMIGEAVTALEAI